MDLVPSRRPETNDVRSGAERQLLLLDLAYQVLPSAPASDFQVSAVTSRVLIRHRGIMSGMSG